MNIRYPIYEGVYRILTIKLLLNTIDYQIIVEYYRLSNYYFLN